MMFSELLHGVSMVGLGPHLIWPLAFVCSFVFCISGHVC